GHARAMFTWYARSSTAPRRRSSCVTNTAGEPRRPRKNLCVGDANDGGPGRSAVDVDPGQTMALSNIAGSAARGFVASIPIFDVKPSLADGSIEEPRTSWRTTRPRSAWNRV